MTDTYIDLKAIPTTGNFSFYVSANAQLTVNTSRGDVLHVNRIGVPHEDGDSLICAVGEDGQPNLSDVWVVNGAIFDDTYDMTYAVISARTVD